uniref:Zinc finger protein 513 n=1 Tax=Oryzias latipes TaxID=8090 RepID=H2L855_ORYLA
MPRRKQSNPQPVKCEFVSTLLLFQIQSVLSQNKEVALCPLYYYFDCVGLALGAELYCLTCEAAVQHSASIDSFKVDSPDQLNLPPNSTPDKKRRGVAKSEGDIPQKLFSCSLCTFTSRYSNHLKRHMRIHDGQKPYRCPACPYASAQLVNLQRHTRTHTGEKPYRCVQCSYACSSLGNLRRHQQMHLQERPKKKEKRQGKRRKIRHKVQLLILLHDQFSSSWHFREVKGMPSIRHYQIRVLDCTASGPLPVLLFPLCCRVCGLTLEESRHSTRRASRRSTKLYRCPNCPFLSHYPNHLARHSLTHSEEKPHHCPCCSYSSSHLDNLKRHMRVHTGEKPYQCPSCSYACGNLANLRRHERIHSGAKPFHCSICGYSCNQSMNLKRHMLRHTGEKPYACGECGYTTGHWDNYKRHQRKHGHNTDTGESIEGWVMGHGGGHTAR